MYYRYKMITLLPNFLTVGIVLDFCFVLGWQCFIGMMLLSNFPLFILPLSKSGATFPVQG